MDRADDATGVFHVNSPGGLFGPRPALPPLGCDPLFAAGPIHSQRARDTRLIPGGDGTLD